MSRQRYKLLYSKRRINMYVFVYGTLKRGFSNHYFLEDAKFIAKATTKDKFPMVNIIQAYPYIINDAGNGHNIEGELYKINEIILVKLDMLEGYPEHYDRRKITIVVENQEYRAIVYFIKKNIDYTHLELLKKF